jgi:hypothetical protein
MSLLSIKIQNRILKGVGLSKLEQWQYADLKKQYIKNGVLIKNSV